MLGAQPVLEMAHVTAEQAAIAGLHGHFCVKRDSLGTFEKGRWKVDVGETKEVLGNLEC